MCELQIYFFLCTQKTAYDMRISDWSSDVCSSDLLGLCFRGRLARGIGLHPQPRPPGPAATPRGPATPASRDDRRAAFRLDRALPADPTSVVPGTSGFVRVAIGGRRVFQQTKPVDIPVVNVFRQHSTTCCAP